MRDISDKRSKLLLILITPVTLLALSATSVQSQDPKPTVDKSDMLTRRESIGDTLYPTSISGEVRWKKDYGLPYNNHTDPPVHPYPCQVFHVHATVEVINNLPVKLPSGTSGQVGTFSGKDFGTAGTPPEIGDSYVCHFRIADLPLDRQVTVQIEIDPSYLPPDYKGFDRTVRLTAPWIGGSQPQPPSGQQRQFQGNARVILTAQQPRGKVVFEMVYAPRR